jgi:hypothetical protein
MKRVAERGSTGKVPLPLTFTVLVQVSWILAAYWRSSDSPPCLMGRATAGQRTLVPLLVSDVVGHAGTGQHREGGGRLDGA